MAQATISAIRLLERKVGPRPVPRFLQEAKARHFALLACGGGLQILAVLFGLEDGFALLLRVLHLQLGHLR